MKKKFYKSGVAAAIAVGVLAVGSGSVYAAYHFLAPSKVAEQVVGSSALADAFNSDEAKIVNQTQNTAGYNVTFLGTVSGKFLIDKINNVDDAVAIGVDKTYAVVAVEKEDGSSMPEISDDAYNTFCVSPLIKGKSFAEANNGMLNAGVYGFVQDGIYYSMLECDNLEPFAGMGVCLGVVNEFGDEKDAFLYDAQTGEYSVNKTYEGVNALFNLPLDISKADDEKANEILTKSSVNNQETTVSFDNVDVLNQKFIDAMNSNSSKWTSLIDSMTLTSENKVKMDEDGNISLSADDKDSLYVGDWKEAAGVECYVGIISDGTLEESVIQTASKNADGTFTVRNYVVK